MKIIQTKFNQHGPVQIQDHGITFVVSYPAIGFELKGYQRERVINKITQRGGSGWNEAQKFAAEKLKGY